VARLSGADAAPKRRHFVLQVLSSAADIRCGASLTPMPTTMPIMLLRRARPPLSARGRSGTFALMNCPDAVNWLASQLLPRSGRGMAAVWVWARYGYV